MSSHCDWIFLELSSSSQPPGALLSPQCQGSLSDPLSSFTLSPGLWFPLHPFIFVPAYSCPPLACLSWLFFLFLPSLSTRPPLRFLSAGSKWKTSVPWSFATVPFIIFPEASRSNPAPRAGSSLPALPARAKAPPRKVWGWDSLFLGYSYTLFSGRTLPSSWSWAEDWVRERPGPCLRPLRGLPRRDVLSRDLRKEEDTAN